MHEVRGESEYPYANLEIACPAQSDRLTAFLRPFLVIPVLFVFVLLIGLNSGSGAAIGGGFLFLPVLLAILFRNRYPRMWFDWNLYLMKFGMRIASYALLLRDEYPSFDDEQFVKIELRYPNVATELRRGMPLVKWLLAIPHYIVLAILSVAVIVVTVIAWFAIIFTGKYPPGMHTFVVSVMRWSLRVNAYAFLLLTDAYPPFKLQGL